MKKLPVVLVIFFRVLLGALFIYTGLLKIANPAAFAEAIENYRMLPYFLVTVMAVVLPWIELLAGVLLILGRWMKGASLILILLNVVFIVAISSAMFRGLDIDCGCFSTSGGSNVGIIRLVEDVVYLAMAVYIFRSNRT